ncbi:MAG: hypothetical protein L6R36_000390 [Xanthoria steineri]|nr:MAG: hypothetical protein L6R36_000390 [Xanthoria steineri]
MMTPAGSPASSCGASPASKQNASSSQLTPRSKVKAMIAAIEDESDSVVPGCSRRPRFRSIDPTVPSNDPESGSESHGSVDSARENSLRKPPAPRGRLAARLQGSDIPHIEEHQNSNDDHDAYARLKKKLANPSPAASFKANQPSPTQGSSDTDEYEIMDVTRKRRKRSPLMTSAEPESRSPHTKSPQPRSPGLFVTPEKEPESKALRSPLSGGVMEQQSNSDSDPSPDPQAKSRLLELVARKREQRLAKEAEATKKARARDLALQESRRHKKSLRDHQISDEESDGSDVEKLTQHIRPTRKASKKAEEENKRQIQRMSRNMQLAHQARTKKKITKESFFAKFHFRTEPTPATAPNPANSSSATASSDRASDDGDDALLHAGSPTTSPMASPATPGDENPKFPQLEPQNTNPLGFNSEVQLEVLEEELPDIQDVITRSQARLDDGKRRAAHDSGIKTDVATGEITTQGRKTVAKKIFRTRLPKATRKPDLAEDSGSDLEILPLKTGMGKVDRIFARSETCRSNQGHSLQTLRALAHLTSPNKQISSTKATMSLSEMQNSLQRRARQQAALERAEKIQELKDRGVIIQTAEERQKDQAEVEDLLENARREAVDLKQREKDRAKKEARANREAVADDTSEGDEDYQENDADESDVELSGSEEEDETEVKAGGNSAEESDGSQQGEEDNVSPHGEGLVLNEASEESDEKDEVEEASEDSGASNAEDREYARPPVRCRHKKVIEDDDDEALPEDQSVNLSPTRNPTQYSNILGFPTFGAAPMGMSQVFAATMADSQTPQDGRAEVADQEEDSSAFLGPPPEPECIYFELQDSPQMIANSQGADATNTDTQANISLNLSQYEVPLDSLQDSGPRPSATQFSDIPDPTQDVGFALSSPLAGRFTSIPPSTVDTVILPRAEGHASPIIKKKGRLRRKTYVIDSKAANADQDLADMIPSANAFAVLRSGSKKSSNTVQNFDKKKSNAKEMVEEQAQESEDEYAGLGGASDDESHGEEDEEVRKMIEQGEVDVDERQLAAFYADKERASDEKAVEKLFKYINNGMLRRKRGAEFDLSDSDDDVEARRRRKRKEFAKMRKALLDNNGNIGKIAEDPKKIAFLRAIEDRENDEDLDFLEQPEDLSRPAIENDSQGTVGPQAEQMPEDPRTAGLGKRKRPLTDSNPDTANRLPPTARRTTSTTMKKPLSLAEIRASVSFLIEEPDAMPIAPPSSSAPASDNENDENDEKHGHAATDPLTHQPATDNDNTNNPFTSRRRPKPVIDRLSLKRNSSSSTSVTTPPSHLAFYNPSTSTPTAFKVPSLLRRATTSSFNTTGVDSHGISTLALADTERGAGGAEKGDFVRRGGTKRSSVNFAARRVVRGVEASVKEGMRRRVTREGSSLSGLGGGSFE